jgi:hypothetical protein
MALQNFQFLLYPPIIILDLAQFSEGNPIQKDQKLAKSNSIRLEQRFGDICKFRTWNLSRVQSSESRLHQNQNSNRSDGIIELC